MSPIKLIWVFFPSVSSFVSFLSLLQVKVSIRCVWMTLPCHPAACPCREDGYPGRQRNRQTHIQTDLLCVYYLLLSLLLCCWSVVSLSPVFFSIIFLPFPNLSVVTLWFAFLLLFLFTFFSFHFFFPLLLADR